jgi:replicative DNA helicase
MNGLDARQEIISRWRDLWQHDKKDGIVCPLCGSGKGTHGSGVKLNTEKKYVGKYVLHCYNGKCNFTGNAIDLLASEMRRPTGGRLRGKDFRDVIEEGARRLGFIVEWKNDTRTTTTNRNRPRSDEKAAANMNTCEEEKKPVEKPKVDYTPYIEKARDGLDDARAVAYLEKRGLSLETAKRLSIGFDAKWINPKGGKFASPRMILPFANGCGYLARSIGDEEQGEKQNVGDVGVFNADALEGGGLVFIVEGAFDAASIEEVGARAIAMNGNGQIQKLIDALQDFSGYLLVAMDNDESGKGAAEKIAAKLEEAGFPFSVVDVCNCEGVSSGCKDANEFLVKDRQAFNFVINDVIVETYRAAAEKAARPDSLLEYFNSGEWEKDISWEQEAALPSGFPMMDKWLDGGFPVGVTMMTAGSSMGKTTFLWNCAESMAAAGTHVLYFSLELPPKKLFAKGLARRAYHDGRDYCAQDFYKGRVPQNVRQKYEIGFARESGANLSVIKRDFGFSVDGVITYIKQYRRRNKGAVVCAIVDYLQCLVDYGTRAENIAIADAVKKLESFATGENISIIAVSNMPRSAYYEEMSFASFYGSNSIEYSCEAAFGFQYAVVGTDKWKNADRSGKTKLLEAAGQEKPRRVALVGLKNRENDPFERIGFKFDGRHCDFVEDNSVLNDTGISCSAKPYKRGKREKVDEIPNMFDDDSVLSSAGVDF